MDPITSVAYEQCFENAELHNRKFDLAETMRLEHKDMGFEDPQVKAHDLALIPDVMELMRQYFVQFDPHGRTIAVRMARLLGYPANTVEFAWRRLYESYEVVELPASQGYQLLPKVAKGFNKAKLVAELTAAQAMFDATTLATALKQLLNSVQVVPLPWLTLHRQTERRCQNDSDFVRCFTLEGNLLHPRSLEDGRWSLRAIAKTGVELFWTGRVFADEVDDKLYRKGGDIYWAWDTFNHCSYQLVVGHHGMSLKPL